MERKSGWTLALAALCLVVAASAYAQTSTTTQKFEVLSVAGNQLVARLGDGTTKEYTVPETFRFQVEGKELTVHDLKPGMTGTATIKTITTEHTVYVTEVRQAEVIDANGNSVVVRGPNGFKMFTEADVTKHNMTLSRDGQPLKFEDIRKGDRLTATIITSSPQTVTQQQVTARLNAAAGAVGGAAAATGAAVKSGAAATGSAIKSAAGATANAVGGAASAATGGGTKHLPKTASELPIVGLTGLALLLAGASLTIARRRRAA
ncbi:MAG TPA: LPXTG cell wall anchor domain-containing protein [Vicinamibacterales bacterium]|nr:LPXTG cell wall anchor domain-containing protein [Vicinamibacterales bacterium]